LVEVEKNNIFADINVMLVEQDRYIRFDWAMKRMLRDKANFAVLEGLLTVLMGEKITIVEILESEGNQQTEDDKFNCVDIKAKDSKDDVIIVEIQNTREIYYLERILYGVAKAVTEHISLGNTYKEVKKVVSISILYFDIGRGSDYLYHGQNRFVGVHTGDELTVTAKERNAIVQRKPQEIFPEYFFIRVNEFNKVAKTPIEEWVEYLKTGTISTNATAPGLPEARERLRYYNMSDNERHAYDEHINAIMIQNDVLDTAKTEGLEEGRAIGIAEGRAEGLSEGELRKAKEIAKNMKAMGMSFETIVSITGLPIDDVMKD